jgi:hypothetical protein
MKRHKLLGYYVPAFFEMHIDTESEDMIINQMPIEDATVLFHEYIHFLQDISSYYGLSRIYAYSEYLHKMICEIYNMSQADFQIPMTLLHSNDNVKLNNDLIRLTEGDVGNKATFSITDIKISEDKLEENVHLQTIPSVMLEFSDDDIATFGAGAISESMAYLLERLCSPNGYKTSPEYPYMAAEKVASFYDEEFAKDKLKILALCDMSLMSSNPGTCFVRVMKSIKKKELSFTSPEAVYDYFYESKTVKATGEETSLIDAFITLQNTVVQCLKSYLKIEEINKAYYTWIDLITNFVIDWRQNHKYFLLTMARHKELFANGCFGYCIKKIGTPLMSNNIPGRYFKIPIDEEYTESDMDVEYFKVIYQIEALLSKGKVSCDMYDWCCNSPSSTPNELCKTSPWLKVSEEELCPYAFLWKHWRLSKYKPYKRL